MRKTCTKCLIEKPFSEFGKDKSSKDGLNFKCKACVKAYYEANKERIAERQKKHRKENQEAIRERSKKYRAENRERINEWHRKNYQANKDAISDYHKRHYYANRESIRERQKQYIEENKEARLEYQKSYHKLKSEEPQYRFKRSLRGRIIDAFKAKGWSRSCSMEEIIGGYKLAFKHIESRFKNGMSWDNYGSWEIDHIVPLNSAESDIELTCLLHYSNTQPLWLSENASKGSKIIACRVEYKHEIVELV